MTKRGENNKNNGYKVIVDAGATKTEWILTDGAGRIAAHEFTAGINPSVSDYRNIYQIIKDARHRIGTNVPISAVYYFGAGCISEDICNRIRIPLSEIFDSPIIEIHSDLYGTVLALLGDKDGIAAILGTGSNVALQINGDVRLNVPPMGYILGDEGSGTALGKRLLNGIFKGWLSENLRNDFLQCTGLTYQSLIDKVYRQSKPNVYIASFTHFLYKHINHPEINKLIEDEFDSFFERNVEVIPDASSYKFAFTGSVAYNFFRQLNAVAHKRGYEISTVLKSPMDGLLKYYSEKI